MHVGTAMLTAFYNEFNNDYDFNKVRKQHSGRIAEFINKIQAKDRWGSWLISGKIMKEKLKLDYDNHIVGITYEQIDGWCFTKNIGWINQFLEHEVKKYENLTQTYEGFQKKWKLIQNN